MNMVFNYNYFRMYANTVFVLSLCRLMRKEWEHSTCPALNCASSMSQNIILLFKMMSLVNIYGHSQCMLYVGKFYMKWFTKEYDVWSHFYEKWCRCSMCMCDSYFQYETTFSLHILLSTKPFGLPFPFSLKTDYPIRF